MINVKRYKLSRAVEKNEGNGRNRSSITHEPIIYEAQKREDARASADGRRPRLIQTLEDAARCDADMPISVRDLIARVHNLIAGAKREKQAKRAHVVVRQVSVECPYCSEALLAEGRYDNHTFNIFAEAGVVECRNCKREFEVPDLGCVFKRVRVS